MDDDTEGVVKTMGDGPLAVAPMSDPASRWDMLQTAFGTPWRAATVIGAMLLSIAASIFVWVQIIGPLPSALLTSELGTVGLAPSVEKPFRCSPNFPFKNNVSKQVEHECKQ